MAQHDIIRLDVKQVLEQKIPKIARWIPGFAVNYLIRTIHQDEMNDIITRYHEKEGVEFLRETAGYFDLTLIPVNEENIPTEGRFIFASNHPLGGLDGICLSSYIGSRFNDRIRYLVNDVLLSISNLRTIFVPINKYGKQGRESARLIDEAYASDNQIITFPAGLCSRKINGKIQDLEWKKSFIQKAIEYKRDVIPVFYEGQNSTFFYRLSYIRKKLGIKANIELFYLPDEMFKAKHSTYRIYFGAPIPWQTFDKSRKPEEWAEWVKQIVYRLNK